MGFYFPKAVEHKDRYFVKVDEYSSYHRNGFLIVRNLLDPDDIQKLREWADQKFVDVTTSRIQMLHRVDPVAEYGLLLPRVLDVVEALVGPDILALQSMIFYNLPGKGGQGWHQDSYYIRTHPDTLIGAWMALEDADEENGCLWVAPGSHSEPIYPPVDPSTGGLIHAEGVFADLFVAENASNQNDEVNALSKVVQKYDKIVPAVMKAGDVLFFHSHLLHRSHTNRSENRLRRSYVCHYCNARSWVPWNHGDPFEGDSANEHHILARGRTHLPYAEPTFGTPVELNHGEEGVNGKSMQAGVSMMGMEDGTVMRVSKNDNMVEK